MCLKSITEIYTNILEKKNDFTNIYLKIFQECQYPILTQTITLSTPSKRICIWQIQSIPINELLSIFKFFYQLSILNMRKIK